ncbi:MAG: FAD-dependent oxidoreductase [Gammaproteobacteria bacterium]|nr:FAD-dependent oxidoreductase [Gammaproteobacteria bacterium]NNJ72004.1 NAD(P)-binding protein [Enterobacterales bacterium]
MAKVAVIGTGIAGNVAAYHLCKKHDITVYEANDYIGGHTHTHEIELDGEQHRIDTGFIVFNHKTYPNFIRLLEEMGVPYKNSDMSFSVACERTGLEYNGTTLNSLFAQRRNFFRPSFYRMIRDILRFNKDSAELLEESQKDVLLGNYLADNNYSENFIEHYIIPMGSAIWSMSKAQMMEFPAQFFVRFFTNHGMLSVDDRPQWYVIENGSKSYLDAMTKGYKDRIRLNSPVKAIERTDAGVVVKTADSEETYDYVFNACHSNQAFEQLTAANQIEQETLGVMHYQYNDVVLHTDESILPKRKLAWAAWNYHLLEKQTGKATLSYDMNILQGLESKHTFCVTVNNSEAIDETKVIKRLDYDHPLFTQESVAAQLRHREVNGSDRIYYCGAYWRYGFHEDGVFSALQALNHFYEDTGDEQQTILR